MEDSYKHKGLRKKLVTTVRNKGIKSEAVLEAIMKVPRHFFMDNAFIDFAYQDKAFPIGADQTISQPYTVAKQTELLNIKRGEKILEIGTGSGYQTCVLLNFTSKVFTIERQKSLYDKTKRLLPKMGYNAKFFFGDGFKGLPGFAPFDKIIITAGAPRIPEDLIDQMKVGGIMIIPVDEEGAQKMLKVTKTGDKEFESEEHGMFKFVPMLPDKAKK